MEDIWITGVGMITSIGLGRDAFWAAAIEGRSGGRRLEHPLLATDQFLTTIGAPVTGFDPLVWNIPLKDVSILDVTALFALAAAHDAVIDAGFARTVRNPRKGQQTLVGIEPDRFGVVIGSGIGGLATTVDNLVAWHDGHRRLACKRYGLPMLMPNAPAAQVAVRFGARAECKSISTACAAGVMAIGDAYRVLRNDEADVMLCGGVEALLSDPELFGLLGFDLLKTLSRRNDDPARASRPFDRDRDGFVLSEGAGIVVLERAGFARARGARPYARVAGYASTCDASSIMQIDADGVQIERAMRSALRRAGLEPQDIQYVNAHGTSTLINDRIESQAIQRVFGAVAGALAVTSTKSMTGHAIAGSGAIEVGATALTLRHGIIAPTINLEHVDPECTLDYLPNKAQHRRVNAALKNAFGFGGHNACLVLTTV